MCPMWVSTLQQAELFAIYEAAKIAAYKGWGAVTIGSDSNVSRWQITGLRANIPSDMQQRILGFFLAQDVEPPDS